MKCWKLQNMARTSNSLHMSQDRELVPLLITCISSALAKDARLVAPGAEFAIYAQSRYSMRATYCRYTKPSCPGTWWQEGDVVSALYLFPDVSAVTAHTRARSLCYFSGFLNCRACESEIMDKHPTSILRDFEREEPGIIFFAFHLKMNGHEREQWGQRQSMYWVQNEIYMWLESLQPISYPPGCLVYCPSWIKI